MLIFILYMFFLFLHEIGHVLTAKIYNLEIEKIGFTIKPVPHFYVAILNVPDNHVKYMIYFSGILVSMCLFLCFWCTHLLDIKSVYIAISIILIIDSNPFYSDFTLAFNERYKFSAAWYIHFIVWGILIYFLIAPLSITKLF